MDTSSWLILFATALLVVLVVTLHSPVTFYSRRHPRSVWLYVLIFLAALLPSVIQTLQVSRRSNAVTESTGSTPLAALAAVSMSAFTIAACLYFGLGAARELRLKYRFLAVALAPWSAAMLITAIHGDYFGYTSFIYPCVVLAIHSIFVEIHVLRYVGFFTFAVAALSLVVGLALPAKGLLHGSSGQLSYADKAIIGDFLLAGPYKHSNVLAVVMALGAPWVLLFARRISSFLALSVIAAALLWTGSRTALVAACAGLLFYCFLRMIRQAAIRRWVCWGGGISGSLTIILVPIFVTDPSAFSSRGRIWLGSRSTWSTNELTGSGYGWYGYIANFHNSLIDIAFNGHNLFVHLATTGGYIYVVGVVVLLFFCVRSAARWAGQGVFAPSAFIVTFLVASTLEVTYRFRDLEVYFPVVALPLLVLCRCTPTRQKITSSDSHSRGTVSPTSHHAMS